MTEKIKKYQFLEGLELEFEMLDISKVLSVKKSMMTVPHRAEFYHILLLDRASGTHYIDFNPAKLEDNMALFIPQNCVNMFDINGVYEGKAIIFTDNFFCKNRNDIRYLQSASLFSDLYKVVRFDVDMENSELPGMMDIMQKEFDRKLDNEKYEILHNMLHIFLLQADREIGGQGFKKIPPSPYLEILLSFKEMIEDSFKSDRSVSSYSAKLNITEKRLNSATSSLLDKTPKQIINERLLLEAKRLLVHSSESIKEIAYELGFDEPTNFVKYFRKNTGNTPSQFRDNN